MTNARRKQAIVGIAGLAVLGAGAYVVTDRVAGDEPRVVSEAGAVATEVPSVTAPVTEPAATAAPTQTPRKDAASPAKSATTKAAPPPSSTPATKTRKQQIDEVKGSAAKAAQEVQRPVTSATVNAADVTVKKVPTASGQLQVFSAPQDLTGKRELAWVLGQKGDKVGAASCTQKISLVAGEPARKRDTLLICWRTSAAKSVYTIAIDPEGKPSAQRSVGELDKVWSAM